MQTKSELEKANLANEMTELFQEVRARTMRIVAPLEIEDYVIQTAEFMSPPRWHIGHTSWFFETVAQGSSAGLQDLTRKIFFSTSIPITRALARGSNAKSAALVRDRP